MIDQADTRKDKPSKDKSSKDVSSRDKPSQPPPAARKAAEREARLKAQLKANLARRKQQARARREGEEDSRAGDLAVGTDSTVAGAGEAVVSGAELRKP